MSSLAPNGMTLTAAILSGGGGHLGTWDAFIAVLDASSYILATIQDLTTTLLMTQVSKSPCLAMADLGHV